MSFVASLRLVCSVIDCSTIYGSVYSGSLGSRLPRFSNVCRLRIIKTRTERRRPGTEASIVFWLTGSIYRRRAAARAGRPRTRMRSLVGVYTFRIDRGIPEHALIIRKTSIDIHQGAGGARQCQAVFAPVRAESAPAAAAAVAAVITSCTAAGDDTHLSNYLVSP